MSSFDDLGRVLRDDAAASAPPASRIDVDAVIGAARARRRPRQWAVGSLALVAVLGLGGLAVGAATPPALIVASETADGAGPESTGADELLAAPEAEGGSPARIDGLLSCGAVPPAAAQGPIGLELAVELASVGESGSDLLGTARVVNVGDASRAVVTGTSAEAVILLDGVVVGEAAVVGEPTVTAVLDPGVSLDLPVRVTTRSCLDGAPLASGDYSVLVLVETRRAVDEPASLLVAPEQPLRLE